MPSCHYVPLLLLVLCGLSVQSTVLSLPCSKNQYAWPMKKPTLCCDLCPPGTRLHTRSETSCGKVCRPCPDGQYADTSNLEMTCNFCRTCSEYMESQSECNGTHNTECTCRAGYRCKDEPCTECVAIQSTTSTTMLPPPTTQRILPPPTTQKIIPASPTDTMPLLVFALLFAIILFMVFFLCWFKAKLGYYLVKKPAPVPTCCEDEKVSKPVQEECEKCDQLLNV